MKRHSIQHGFSLVELLVVVAILALIAGIAAPIYNAYIETTRASICAKELSAIQIAEEEYFLANNTYFGGADIPTLAANSTGIYIPSPDVLGGVNPSPCAISVVAGTTGNLASSYNATAVGINDLAAAGVAMSVGN